MKYDKLIISSITAALLTTAITPFEVEANENIAVRNELDVKKISGNTVEFNNGEKAVQLNNKIITKNEDNEVEFEVIKIDENNVKVLNKKTGESEIITKESQKIASPQLNQENITTQSTSIHKSEGIKTLQTGSGYKFNYQIKNSTSIRANKVSLVASILASFAGVAIGVMTGVASYYVSTKAKQAYWIEKVYSKPRGKHRRSVKTNYVYYRYHDYTKYIKTISKVREYVG
ncbi:hypothetical protein [Mammaliicoccus sciuri]|uniref:hypothetical protein n=1 Tax=Mammaliicoccus sciuri TaxID=1296 RepID=UPI001FB32037|nr:hypothetical protein [Mammaliicoccus sciuri]MCJ1778804.1 hypothetical protein [Mammaliicoccus sciuri]UXV31112.1 hypothetical protein MUA60_08985 [Mammaliicoccus sciuri]